MTYPANPIPHHLHNTPLANRTLWYDGDSTISSQAVSDEILAGHKVEYVDKITPEILAYNKLVSPADQIRVKQSCDIPPIEWIIPDQFAQLDIVDHLFQHHDTLVAKYQLTDVDKRLTRLADEIVQYQQRGLFGLLRALAYVINTLSNQNIVWGVGRGSSTSSYLLFTLGVHDVDSYLYDLSFADFMRD